MQNELPSIIHLALFEIQAAFLTSQNILGDLPEEKLRIVVVERGLAICDAYK
jgi:hypothetical protein